MKQRIIIALGGNAIKQKGEKGTFEEQYKNVHETMKSITPLLQDDNNEIVITHGNGPQVGSILIQNATAKNQTPELPMFVCGAMSQGEIGLFIQQSIRNIFAQKETPKEVATIITQVEVDPNDPAFENPTKPVGPFYTKEEAEKIIAETGYNIIEDAGRGYRRVVPSPKPKSVIEIEFIEEALENDNLVICSGGGGIPVIYRDNLLEGVDAVIDKDRVAALMADNLDADQLIILTAVDQISLNFGQNNEKTIDQMTIEQTKKYLDEGHFAEGSMKPKVEAIVDFVSKKPGRKGLVTSATRLTEALNSQSGTWIIA